MKDKLLYAAAMLLFIPAWLAVHLMIGALVLFCAGHDVLKRAKR